MSTRRSSLFVFVTLLFGLAPASDARSAPPAGTGPGLSLRRAISFPLVLPSARPPYRFVVPSDEGPVEVTLRGHSIRAPGFRWLVGRGGALLTLPPPPPRTLRGTARLPSGAVVPAAGARVAGGVSLVIQAPSGRLYVQPVSGGPTHVSYRESDTLPGPWRCGVVDELVPTPGTKAAPSGVVITDLAVETDTFYAQAFGGDPAAVLDDIESVLNLVSFLYENEVGVTFEISALVVQTGPTDHYASTAADGLLDELRKFWNKNLGGIKRDLVHLATGRDLDGSIVGLAFLGVVCTNPSFAYGLTQLKFSPNMSLRVALMAHEIGHNFGANHCDGDADCSIMCSVLTQCSGDISQFGQTATSEILGHLAQADCLSKRPGPLPAPFLDTFASKKPDTGKWSKHGGASISKTATGEPSGKYALRLAAEANGVPHEATSRPVDVTSLTQPQVRFWFQTRGVDAGERLLVYGRQSDGSFSLLGFIVSGGQDDPIFLKADFPILGSHKNGAFQLRLRSEVDETDDEWFVDDVVIGEAPPAPTGPMLCGETIVPVWVSDPAGGVPPPNAQVKVANCGKAGTSLPWTATAAAGSFFSVSPSSGTVTPSETFDTVTVSFGTGLPVGLHRGLVHLANGAVTGDAAHVPVVLVSHSGTLFVPGDVLTGTIDTPTDTDEADVVGVAGAKLVLEVVVPNGDVKPVVEVMDASGSVLAKLKFPASKKGTKKKFKFKTTGLFRLRVSGRGGSTGAYEIHTSLKLPKSAGERVVSAKPSKKGGEAVVEVAVLAPGRAFVTVAPKKVGQGPYGISWVDPDGFARDVGPYATPLETGGVLLDLPVSWPGIHEVRVSGFAKKESVLVTVVPPPFVPGQSTRIIG